MMKSPNRKIISFFSVVDQINYSPERVIGASISCSITFKLFGKIYRI